jgi:trehalose-phosphatase
MRNLLENWNSVRLRVQNAKAIALFLDFDGTLAPLQARPEDVRLPPATRRVLRRLCCRKRLRVWVISGRRQADVCERVALRGVRCLGLYGWENGAQPKLNAATQRKLDEARSELAQTLDPAGNVWIEDKGAAFAVHYRGAKPAVVQGARAAVEKVQRTFNGSLRVAEGDHIWEVMPRELRGKGHAVRRYLHCISRWALPIYLGDDAGDEPAFAALSRGITACVGPSRSTHAHFRLRNPAEVCQILENLDRDTRENRAALAGTQPPAMSFQ